MTHAELIKQLSRPLAPQPTEVEAQIRPIAGIRAVLLDVYGTLFISASGDIALAGDDRDSAALMGAMEATGIRLSGSGESAAEMLRAEILRRHAAAASDYPEVEIRDVWNSVLRELHDMHWIDQLASDAEIERLAVEYETRVNPVWPMPGLLECLGGIRSAGMAMGIVSNAQFFTPLLFPALTGSTASELGFADELCIWSYQHLRAKPDAYLYEQAVSGLAEWNIQPHETLYVGNDVRNDIGPAASVGFRTVLFAGDARSLRLRPADPLVKGVEPEAVVTDLRQLSDILQFAPARP